MKPFLLFAVLSLSVAMTGTTSGPEYQSFRLDDLLAKQKKQKGRYLQFLDEATLSSGIYRLPKGSRDGQRPHGQDEVYYVISGRASFTAGAKTEQVGPGAVLFVAAGVEHRFSKIEEDLTLLVFFSKAKPAKRDPRESAKPAKQKKQQKKKDR